MAGLSRKFREQSRDRFLDGDELRRLFGALAIEDDGMEFRPIPPLSPKLNPFAEAWVQRVKKECLDWFIVFGEQHLRHVLSCWLDHYHTARHHFET